MILVQPINFSEFALKQRYIVNEFRLKTYYYADKRRFEERVGCELHVVGQKTGKTSLTDAIVLVCKDPEHQSEDRFCTGPQPLYMNRDDIMDGRNRSSSGSIIVRVYNNVCHVCGVQNRQCWQEWNNHFVCAKCIEKGKGSGPFPHGIGKQSRCCEQRGCGDSMFMSMAELQSIYKRVQLICDKYSVHPGGVGTKVKSA